MTFTIDIDDQYIASRIKSELGRLISVHVDEQVRVQFAAQLYKFTSSINEAVTAYLEKKLTADVIKNKIDKSVALKIEELTRRLEESDRKWS